MAGQAGLLRGLAAGEHRLAFFARRPGRGTGAARAFAHERRFTHR
ncbi:hypothetical protein [Sciscionella marina]|nr:hypothetical protein [Sciscionella marina]